MSRVALFCLLLVGCASAPFAPKSEDKAGYAYAGLEGPLGSPGVRATIRSLARAHVPEMGSHVAGWVGVDAKVDGKLRWLQVGLFTDPASVSTGNTLYLEHRSPAGYKLERLRTNVPIGARFRVAVEEVKAGLWRATVDGKSVGEVELTLPRGAWNATAAAESYTVGSEPNRYRYGFANVEVLSGGSWVAMPVSKVLGDARNKVVDRRDAGFVATSAASRGLAGVLDDASSESSPPEETAAPSAPGPAPATAAPPPKVCPLGALGE